MTLNAQLVIIGGGIVGASCAYHLAKAGWRNILLVDKGPLPHNDGSTSHAPGGVVVASHNQTLTRFGHYTSNLLRSLPYQSPDHNLFNPVGGLEIARSHARWEDLKRLHGACRSFGVETQLMTPQEAQAKMPLLNPASFKGALFVPDNAIIKGTFAIDALLHETGCLTSLQILPHTPITGFEMANGRVAALTTANPEVPRIACETVLLCTNIWSSALSDRLGVPTPLMAFEHQYVITEPIAALAHVDPADKAQEVQFPTTRDLDKTLYFRQHWQAYGVGSYWHQPHRVSPHALTLEQNAMHPFTPDDFEAAWELSTEMLPALDGASLTTKFNGMFAFSVDGMPIMGESAVPGFWVAAASWISHAGGVGKSMAEWMTHGETEFDMRQCSLDRFSAYATTQRYVEVVTSKNYREVYDIIHPRQPITEPRNVRLSPFHARHEALEATFTPFAGIELPNWYAANSALLTEYAGRIPARTGWAAQFWSPIQGAEHLAVRERAGMFDMTGLSIIEVRGTDAMAAVNRLCTGELDRPPGSVVYTCWLTHGGGIKRDLTVARLEDDRYWLFVGEGTLPLDLAWVREQTGDAAVNVADVSAQYTALGVWGPRARAIVSAVTSADVSNDAFPYFTAQWIEIGMARVFAMRISYVGELGWELHIPIDQALPVWDALWEAGQPHGMIAAGMGAMDSLRLEKGYRLWGADIHTEHNLYEARLRWTARMKKEGGFIGLEATRQAAKDGVKKRLCCLKLTDPAAVAFGYEAVLAGDETIGYVTTGNTGYSVGHNIAYAHLPKAYASPGTEVDVMFFAERYPATVVAEPVFDPEMTRLKG